MATQLRTVQFIGGHEGKVLTWYLDPAHVPTIGYGFTWSSRVFRDYWLKTRGRKFSRGDTIGEAEALAVLRAILDQEHAPPVERRLAGLPTQVIEPAKSMVYNCGPGALDWSWAQKLAAGAVTDGIARWRTTGTTAGGKALPGLVRRRNEEADIAATGRWPAWVRPDTTPPDTHIADIDIRQAQLWLAQLGYAPGETDGIPGPRTAAAIRRFQSDHGTLKVDGIIGRATLAALQRAIDLRGKAVVTGGAGAGAATAGAAEQTTGAADSVLPAAHFLGEALLIGGLAFAALGLAWLAWRYRDELLTGLRTL